MAKKWVKEYQPRDPNTGDAIGPKQVFEADTQQELIDKLAAAHENASVAVYKTKQAAKLGTLISVEPDPDMPVKTYEEKVLSADDRIQLAAALKDPANTPHVIKKLLASFGIPADDIRELLQERENQKRIDFVNQQVALFNEAHPEYVGSDFNNDKMLRYLNKNDLACTKKNLEIAYADLTSEGLLTIRAAEQPTPEAPVTPEPEVAAAPAPELAIPASATTAAPISAPATEVRPKSSSSGLSSRGSSAASATGAAPKVAGITAQDIIKMTSEDFDYALQHGLYNYTNEIKDGKNVRVQGSQIMTPSEFRKFADTM